MSDLLEMQVTDRVRGAIVIELRALGDDTELEEQDDVTTGAVQSDPVGTENVPGQLHSIHDGAGIRAPRRVRVHVRGADYLPRGQDCVFGSKVADKVELNIESQPGVRNQVPRTVLLAQ